ncbi:hypothetical protein HDU93_002261 [Gonapodya sp. JEL0774]|nr:hypothetical protein HDU93_002261 [Gonapodya sp. JEL0774]
MVFDINTTLAVALEKILSGGKADSTFITYENALICMESLLGINGRPVPRIEDEKFSVECLDMLKLALTINCSRSYVEKHTGRPTNTRMMTDEISNERVMFGRIPARGLSMSTARIYVAAMKFVFGQLGMNKPCDPVTKRRNYAKFDDIEVYLYDFNLMASLNRDYKTDGGLERHAPIMSVPDILKFYRYCEQGDREGRPLYHAMQYVLYLNQSVKACPDSPWLFPAYTRAAISGTLVPERHILKANFENAIARFTSVVDGNPLPFAGLRRKGAVAEDAENDIEGSDLDYGQAEATADVLDADLSFEEEELPSYWDHNGGTCHLGGIARFRSRDIQSKLSRHRTQSIYDLYAMDAADLHDRAVRKYGFDPVASVYSWESIDPDFCGAASDIPEIRAKRIRQAGNQ